MDATIKTYIGNDIEVEFEVEFDIVDSGIGGYEFGSVHSVHHDIGLEIENINACVIRNNKSRKIDASKAKTFDAEKIVRKELEENLEKYLPEPDYPDYE